VSRSRLTRHNALTRLKMQYLSGLPYEELDGALS
jgi:hypothetical protein